MTIYTDCWKCRNRIVDSGGNPVPKNPMLCDGCPDYKEIRVDQESEPFPRCLQAPEGSLKADKFRHIWERLG